MFKEFGSGLPASGFRIGAGKVGAWAFRLQHPKPKAPLNSRVWAAGLVGFILLLLLRSYRCPTVRR